MADVKQTVTRKVGPLPVWGWLVAAIAAWYVFKHFSTTTQSAASTMQPNSVDTGSGSAAASGQGGVPDQFTSDLLSQLSNNAAEINSNLVTGLMNSNNAIAGLGSEALSYNGQLQQAIIESYTPTGGSVVFAPTPYQSYPNPTYTAPAISAPAPAAPRPPIITIGSTFRSGAQTASGLTPSGQLIGPTYRAQ